jgi:hypothetical protein
MLVADLDGAPHGIPRRDERGIHFPPDYARLRVLVVVDLGEVPSHRQRHLLDERIDSVPALDVDIGDAVSKRAQAGAALGSAAHV